MTSATAAIVTLGRARGMGEVRRVESWQDILTTAGLEPHVVRLRRECPASLTRPPSPLAVIRGEAAVETMSWSMRAARTRLSAVRPALTVFVTLRAFHPALGEPAGVAILDLVDRLSVNYRDRAALSDSRRGAVAYRTLGAAMERAERHRRSGIVTTAAGRADAEALGALWVPNVVAMPPEQPVVPDHDLVFFGNLAYPPNIAAVERLAEWWPELQRRRPGTTLLVAGRSPAPRVRAATAAMGATLEDGYDEPFAVARRGRVAVAPLAHAAGIQNKVIEAAAAGVPQILSSEAASGLPEGFPCEVADEGRSFSEATQALLTNDDRRRELAAGARQAACSMLTPRPWADWVQEVLS